MKFAYPENELFIEKLETEKLFGPDAVRGLVKLRISNLRQIANFAERESRRKNGEETGKKLLEKARVGHERANELQAYLDERKPK